MEADPQTAQKAVFTLEGNLLKIARNLARRCRCLTRTDVEIARRLPEQTGKLIVREIAGDGETLTCLERHDRAYCTDLDSHARSIFGPQQVIAQPLQRLCRSRTILIFLARIVAVTRTPGLACGGRIAG